MFGPAAALQHPGRVSRPRVSGLAEVLGRVPVEPPAGGHNRTRGSRTEEPPMTTSVTTSSATSALEARPEIVADEKPLRTHAGWTLVAAVGVTAAVGAVVWAAHSATSTQTPPAAPASVTVVVPDTAVGAMRGWEPRNLAQADAPTRGHLLVRTAVTEQRLLTTLATGHGRALLNP